MILTPTPTAPDRHTRRADFATMAEALDFAASQSTGINLHSLRGELTDALAYSELAETARELAGVLLALGLEPGDRVALAAESDADFLRTFFACQYAGLTPAPLPLPAPLGGKDAYLAHVRRMLRSSGANAAFAPPTLATWFEEAADGLGLVFTGSVGTLPNAKPESLPRPDPEGLCYLQFSSGSTRFPKGVAVTQKALMANIVAIGRAGLGVGASDRTVSWLPLYHDMGLVGMLLTSIAFQVSIDLLPTGAFVRRPKLWLDLISSRGGTISYAPTFGYDLVARRAGGSAADDLDLSRWRVAGLGGDMIRPEPLRAFAQAYEPAGFDGRAFVASYGMAEATLALTLTPPGQGLRTDTIDLGSLERTHRAEKPKPRGRSREFALCGQTLAGHRLEVRADNGAVLGERGVGRIFATGPSLMKTYFDEPSETARVLSADGWLDTGDVGYVVDDQIVITGRAKDLIIINGRNIWPQDLEWTAEKYVTGLRNGDVAVFSATADEGEEQVIALVQIRGSDQAARRAACTEVANLLRSRHGVDVAVIAVAPHSLPQTSSGKLSRSGAKALYMDGAFSATPFARARGGMNGRLVAVTGATGFLGRRLVPRLNARGWRVRILARDPAAGAKWDGQPTETVVGDLDDTDALSRLAAGADHVIHAAGLIKARSRTEFFAINEGGARRVAIAAGGRRLIHVSSLAARQPDLSDYAASKRAGEEAIDAVSRATSTIVRPPAIYGPGDKETLPLFKAAGGPIAFAPGGSGARIAIVEVDDVADVIVDLLEASSPPGIVTIGGDRPGGYRWDELIAAAASAVGGDPTVIATPPWLLKVAGAASELAGRLRDNPPIFTLGKAREALHLDWSVSAAEQSVTVGRAYTPLADGFARAVAWYRANEWLS